MARISHIAIAVSDPEAARDFYVNGLGLEVVGELDSPTALGYYLSDGHVNLALLKFKSDEPAMTEGAPRHAGIHHFGVKVENMEEARADRGCWRCPSALRGRRGDGKAGQRRDQVLRPRRRHRRPVRGRLGWRDLDVNARRPVHVPGRQSYHDAVVAERRAHSLTREGDSHAFS